MGKANGYIIVDTEMCKGCEICVSSCPFDVLRLSKSVNKKGYNYSQMNNENCTGCTSCAIMCPDSCITVYRKKTKS